MTDYYPPNSRARIAAPEDPTDPFLGRIGTVDWTRNDGSGEMVHRVQFGDGNSSWYYAEELCSVRRDHHETRRS